MDAARVWAWHVRTCEVTVLLEQFVWVGEASRFARHVRLMSYATQSNNESTSGRLGELVVKIALMNSRSG